MPRLIPAGAARGPQGLPGNDGLPGVNAVPADEAIGVYIGTAGTDSQAAVELLRDHPLRPYFSDEKWADVLTGDPTLNHRDEIQAAIIDQSNAGGRIYSNKPLVFNIQGGPLLVPARTVLDLPGTEFRGDGTNTIIETAWWNGSTLESTADLFVDTTAAQDGTSAQHCSHTHIRGIKFTDCAIGARLQWFVGASSIEDCWFDTTCTTFALWATCSWSSNYRWNTFKQAVKVSHFADGITLENNEWEACSAGIGLEVGTAGSWSLRVVGNMFHWITSGEGTALKFTGGAENTVIQGNHFESNKRHIYGSTNTCRGMEIRGNHLAATSFNADWSPLVAVEFLSLRNSFIGPNDFTIAGGTTEAAAVNKYVILSTQDCYYNEVFFDNAPGTGGVATALARCTFNVSTIVRSMAGSNDPTLTQVSRHEWSGAGVFTAEKYVAKYRLLSNQIPHVTVDRTGGSTHVLTTGHVETDASGLLQPCYFWLKFVGASNTYIIAGRIAGRFDSAVYDSLHRLSDGAAAPTPTFSNSGGKLRITIAGLDNPTTITGFVKCI